MADREPNNFRIDCFSRSVEEVSRIVSWAGVLNGMRAVRLHVYPIRNDLRRERISKNVGQDLDAFLVHGQVADSFAFGGRDCTM